MKYRDRPFFFGTVLPAAKNNRGLRYCSLFTEQNCAVDVGERCHLPLLPKINPDRGPKEETTRSF